MITVPHPNPDFIRTKEPVSPSVTNRPMMQIHENLLAIAEQAGAVVPSATPNPAPSLGEEWTDQYGKKFIWNGTFWEPSNGMFVQETQPQYGREGLFWWKPSTDNLYVHNGYYYGPLTTSGGTTGGGSSVFASLAVNNFSIPISGGETFLPFVTSDGDVLHVYLDSVMLEPNVDFTYDLTGINFNAPISAGSKVSVTKFSTGSVSANIVISNTDFTTTADGKTFSFSSTDADTVQVYIDGVMVNKTKYTLTGSEILFTENVPSGSNISIIKTTTVGATAQANVVVEETEQILSANTTTIPYSYVSGDTISIYQDGILMSKSEYTIEPTAIIFNTPIQAGALIQITKMSPNGAAAMADNDAIAQFDAIYNA